MKVLVTGGCGFLGSHVCEVFLARGWEVVSFDNMTKAELARTGYQTDAARDHNWSLLESLGSEMLKGDIRDLDHLLDASSGCDYLVHTAAQPAVTISLENPLLDHSSNVTGSLHVLETARRHGIPIASCATVHVYGNWVNDSLEEQPTRYIREPASIAEDEPTMRGYLTPLHASKASAEHYVTVYASSYGVRAASFSSARACIAFHGWRLPGASCAWTSMASGASAPNANNCTPFEDAAGRIPGECPSVNGANPLSRATAVK